MHLSPRDLDKLTLHATGFLAQKRLARGVKLNYPEAVALIAATLLELIRDGKHGVAELMDTGRQMLGRRQVMPGVPELIAEVQVEGTFPDGTKLVTVHHPIVRADGDLALALYGSFLPVPPLDLFTDDAATVAADAVIPGEVAIKSGEIVLNEGRAALEITVKNTGDRPIQVGSHFPFAETNRALDFDRAAAAHKRLDIPAGAAVRFEPGDEKTVRLIPTATSPTVATAASVTP